METKTPMLTFTPGDEGTVETPRPRPAKPRGRPRGDQRVRMVVSVRPEVKTRYERLAKEITGSDRKTSDLAGAVLELMSRNATFERAARHILAGPRPAVAAAATPPAPGAADAKPAGSE